MCKIWCLSLCLSGRISIQEGLTVANIAQDDPSPFPACTATTMHQYALRLAVHAGALWAATNALPSQTDGQTDRQTDGHWHCSVSARCYITSRAKKPCTWPNFTRFPVHADYGRGSNLLWRRWDMLCTSGFVDGGVVSHAPRTPKRSSFFALATTVWTGHNIPWWTLKFFVGVDKKQSTSLLRHSLLSNHSRSR